MSYNENKGAPGLRNGQSKITPSFKFLETRPDSEGITCSSGTTVSISLLTDLKYNLLCYQILSLIINDLIHLLLNNCEKTSTLFGELLKILTPFNPILYRNGLPGMQGLIYN
jgi:hypothetical protein